MLNEKEIKLNNLFNNFKHWLEDDYYKLLGIRQNAEPDEIKKAFKMKAKKFHPDNFPAHSPERKKAENTLKILVSVRNILLNPLQRNEYDQNRQFYQDSYINFINNKSSLLSTESTPVIKNTSFQTDKKVERLKSYTINSSYQKINDEQMARINEAFIICMTQ